ncbi:sigma-70 family RNA polymerase sigma factor, partial [Myxococcota bacterium]|nr:sigma-70 family RNA polymerase sigma factor [Myxococcota bacterium]
DAGPHARRASVARTSPPLHPRPTIPDPGATRPEPSSDRDAAKPGAAAPDSADAQASSGPSVPADPELVWDDADAEDEDDEDAEEQGPILDVGTMPSLPSMPSVDSRASVPALRAREGITRAGALERFLQEMGRYPLLTPQEENELTTAYYERQDPVAARKLVVHNLRLVVKMAYKYRRAWANVLDLIQEGNVGLVEAVRRFDPFKGAKFSTYATFWIRAYMLRYLLEHSRMVRISRTRVGRKLFFRLSKEREKLRAQGIEPGPKLLAERLGVGESELEEVVRHMDQSEVRLDAPMYNDDASAGTMLDAMTGEGASPEAQMYRKEFDREVSNALESFAATLTDPREKVAWKDHLMAEDPASLSELGARFGVTKQRMGQIVAALRKRLKDHLIETLGPDVQLGFSLDAE